MPKLNRSRREARLKTQLASLSGEHRDRLRLRAEAAAREKNPRAAQLYDRGRGKRAWEKLLEAELHRLISDHVPAPSD